MVKKTHIEIATDVFRRVCNLPENTASNAHLGDRELTSESSLEGVVLSSILWDTDRGNWSWDGALAALEAVGIDVNTPLVDAAKRANA